MEGTVKFYDRTKGFGFIKGNDGKDYYVNSEVLGEGVSLYDNDAVSFDAQEGQRGPKAVNVRKGQGSSHSHKEEAAEEEESFEDEADEEESEEDSESFGDEE